MFSTISLIDAIFVISVENLIAFLPNFSISLTACWFLSSSLPTITTLAPLAANARTIVVPNPLFPPVTIAVFY
jgi:hypothetical protein